VGEFCAIRASFHAPIPGVKHELIITPKMSFGTGHHATTYMMIRAMEHLDLSGRSVLDFGTGTGSWPSWPKGWRKSGNGHRSRLLEHQQCPGNMMENRAERVTVEKMETLPDKSSFDVILANINKHVIIKELPAMRQQLRKGGVILLSGLLHEDLFDIENESFKNDLPISERLNEGNWICLKLTKEGN